MVDTFTAVTSDEPAGGFGQSFTDVLFAGMPNGSYTNSPPDTALDITNDGTNDMPDIRPTFVSGTKITFRRVANASSISGWALQATIAAGGAAGDSAYVEWIVDISGDQGGGFPDKVKLYFVAGVNTGTFSVDLKVQYLTNALATTGMPAEQVQTSLLASGATISMEVFATPLSVSNSTARYLRVRVFARRGAAATTAAGTISLMPIRRSNVVSKIDVTTPGAFTYYVPSGASFVYAILIAGGGGGGSGRRAPAGTVRGGGGGGCGGGSAVMLFAASDLAASFTVTVGAGGAGAAAAAADGSVGNDGSTGGATTFGTYLSAEGGMYGGGASGAAGGAGGDPSLSGAGMFPGAKGGNGGVGTGTGVPNGSSGPWTAGGGGGGGISVANVNDVDGGDGGKPTTVYDQDIAGPGAFSSGGLGGAGSNPVGAKVGGGGGGGAAENGVGGTTGGGGIGAGGGGGGGRTNGSTGRAGGAGGGGRVVIVAW